ncbi:MAG: hypothetical protein FWG66_02865 [Spirochaetes bacterium]|nr:hypothetical protein [Spirochaetota bacterium]
MALNELAQHSSIRILEQSIDGGLKAGEIGVIASPSGIGKTSVLVQLALDKLLQAKKIIHVSFTQHTNYVFVWYEDLFGEFAKRKNFKSTPEMKADLVKNRVLMNFNQDGISKEQILRSLRAMIVEGGFAAEAVIIDGFDFSRTTYDCIASVKAFAKELGLCVWYSCNVKDGEGQHDVSSGMPLLLKTFEDQLDVVITLGAKQDYIELCVTKDRQAAASQHKALRLDPKTMLILEA